LNIKQYKNLNICVVGAGSWGMNHVRTLFELGVLAGIVEQDKEAVQSLKIAYPDCIIDTELTDALDRNYDGFIVATPPASHFEIGKKIILSNKPLLIEKPLTLNLNDAIELNNLAKRQKVNLMVGHLLLFHPAFKKMAELIESGLLGQIQYIYSNRLNLGTFRSDENVFWSFAPHDISLFQYFFKNSPSKVNSSGIDILQKGIHDTTITSFHYEKRRMGHIFVSWLHPFKEHRFVLVGSEGMIHFEDSSTNKPLLFYDKKVQISNDELIPKIGVTKSIDYKKEFPLTNEIKYFLKHLDGKNIEIANGDSAVEVIKILEQATFSLRKNTNE